MINNHLVPLNNDDIAVLNNELYVFNLANEYNTFVRGNLITPMDSDGVLPIAENELILLFRVVTEALMMSAIETRGVINDNFPAVLKYILENNSSTAYLNELIDVDIADIFNNDPEFYTNMYDRVSSVIGEGKIILNWDGLAVTRVGVYNRNQHIANILIIDSTMDVTLFLERYEVDRESNIFGLLINEVIAYGQSVYFDIDDTSNNELEVIVGNFMYNYSHTNEVTNRMITELTILIMRFKDALLLKLAEHNLLGARISYVENINNKIVLKY